MNGSTAELHLFPKHMDRFITWGSEICLYQVKNTEDVDQKTPTNINLYISASTTASLLATEIRYQYIRCVAPSHRSGEPLLAVGLANGKVGLCNFVPSTENNIEFTPKQSRPCVCLAWHEFDTNLLAICHDRNRSDHCITVWDTERGLPKEKAVLNLIGLSETAHSICWDKQNKVLVAGMSHKTIKLMDLRQSNPLVTATNTRAVHGLCIAPNGRYLASYIDNQVTLWDIRNIEKPISVYQLEKNVNSLSWCSTRQSTLATLQRDSPYVQLLDLHCPTAVISTSEPDHNNEPHSIKRIVAPFQTKSTVHAHRNITLANISWHPVDVERMFALSGSGQICDFRIPQRVAISFDPFNNLCGTLGESFSCLSSTSMSPPSMPDDLLAAGDDIADLIHRRALNDYGKLPEIQKNGDLAENAKLRSVWKLLAHTSNREESFAGLKTILGISGTLDGPPMCRSETSHIYWIDFPLGPAVKYFKSEQRDLAHQLCGWTFDKSSKDSLQVFIDHLCVKYEYTRAAMIACFQLKIRLAIDVLLRGAERNTIPQWDRSNLSMAALALSGLCFEKSAMWRSQCSIAHSQITDSHLRAIFAFLTPDNDHSYDTVLQETGVSVSDRMAFGCQYLCDTKLSEYVKSMIQTCVDLGDLNGLLLTGATSDGIGLLQSYVDWTEDVQTVALIAVKFLPKELINDNCVLHWISSYRELLDIWGLWEQRAHFDIQMGRSSPKYGRSVFLLCSFCGKSVSAFLQEESRMRPTSPNVNKLSSCPNCRKPLPRCSLCMLHMGTTTGLSPQNSTNTANHAYGWQSKPFSKWFSWCQTCRHGGHTEHLTDWFRLHSECPVSSCSCKCFALDLAVPQFQNEPATY